MIRVLDPPRATLTRATDNRLGLDEYWDAKLSKKFALAPRNIQADGDRELTEELYKAFNLEFDNHCSDFVREELTNMQAEKQSLGESLKDSTICIFGPGLGRGLRFARYAHHSMKMTIRLYDVSRLAVSITNFLLKSKELPQKSLATIKEITGVDEDIPVGTKLIVMSQFLQILQPRTMSSIMKMIARYTERNRDCRTIIVHPFDNDDANMGWGDTTPYTLQQLLSPTKKVIGKSLISTREQSILYFGLHKYKAITLTFS